MSSEVRPTVSVVVPFFNGRGHLRACIEGLLAQEGVDGDCEYLLIDNGSTDGSDQIVAEYPQLQLLHETGKGAYRARNRALQQARGSLIAFTDADCSPAPNWLAQAQRLMDAPAIGIAVGRCLYPQNASLALRLLGAYENAKADQVLRRCASSKHFAYANNMVVRAEVFDRIGPFKEWQRAGDTEFAHRMAAELPELELIYSDRMVVTHREFVRARRRLRRLSLYTQTNQQVTTFEELALGERFAVLLNMVRRSF